MDYWKYTLQVDPELGEILLALLSEAPFEAFEETEDALYAYLPAPASPPDGLLDELAAQWHFAWEKALLPAQNWNEVWESNFQPVRVHDFCGIRADFHPPFTGVAHELIIHPKMAFGTGHHDTTWMCLAALEQLPVAGARVLDYGCGTGILGILAARLGAAHVEAVDIEAESYASTIENAVVNGVADRISAHCGTLLDVPPGPYYLILANINRNVLLQSMQAMADLLQPGGCILASGFLEDDEPVLRQAVQDAGLRWTSHQQRGRWLAAVFTRPTSILVGRV